MKVKEKDKFNTIKNLKVEEIYEHAIEKVNFTNLKKTPSMLPLTNATA